MLMLMLMIPKGKKSLVGCACRVHSVRHFSNDLGGNVVHHLIWILFAPSSPAVESTCLVQVDSWVLNWPDCLVSNSQCASLFIS